MDYRNSLLYAILVDFLKDVDGGSQFSPTLGDYIGLHNVIDEFHKLGLVDVDVTVDSYGDVVNAWIGGTVEDSLDKSER